MTICFICHLPIIYCILLIWLDVEANVAVDLISIDTFLLILVIAVLLSITELFLGKALEDELLAIITTDEFLDVLKELFAAGFDVFLTKFDEFVEDELLIDDREMLVDDIIELIFGKVELLADDDGTFGITDLLVEAELLAEDDAFKVATDLFVNVDELLTELFVDMDDLFVIDEVFRKLLLIPVLLIVMLLTVIFAGTMFLDGLALLVFLVEF